jgi:hypothetical protein
MAMDHFHASFQDLTLGFPLGFPAAFSAGPVE